MNTTGRSLWAYEDESKPESIAFGTYWRLWMIGLFGAFPACLPAALYLGWRPSSHWDWVITVLLYVGISIGSIYYVWFLSRGMLDRWPTRVCSILLGSLPTRFAELIVRFAFILVGVLIVSLIASALVRAASLMQRHQAAAVVIGFALCGLFWSVLFAAIRALLALGTVKPRPTFAVHYLGKDAREFQDGDLEPDITIAHLSDCHLTKSEDVLTTERHPGGIGALNRILHNKRDKLLGTDAVVLSGDAVDSGHALEWSHLFRLLREYSLVERVYLIPGNHELNIPEAQSRGRQMTASMLRIRRIRFLGAMRDSAAAVCKCFDGTAEKTIGDLFDRHNDFLQETIVWLDVEFPLLYVGSSGDEKAQVELAMKKQQIDERLQQIWEAAFPYWQPLSNGLLLIALDSNCFSTNLASNAFGEVSASQLTKLRQLGEQFPHCRPLIAMHHHPIDPTHRATLFPIEDKFLGLTNSVEFFSTIVNSFAIDPIIINGHRHMDVASRVSVSNGSSEGSAVIDVYASPSSTFGRSQDEGSPGFYVLGFSDLEDRVRLISRVWNRCCGEPEDRARGTERSTL